MMDALKALAGWASNWSQQSTAATQTKYERYSDDELLDSFDKCLMKNKHTINLLQKGLIDDSKARELLAEFQEDVHMANVLGEMVAKRSRKLLQQQKQKEQNTWRGFQKSEKEPNIKMHFKPNKQSTQKAENEKKVKPNIFADAPEIAFSKESNIKPQSKQSSEKNTGRIQQLDELNKQLEESKRKIQRLAYENAQLTNKCQRYKERAVEAEAHTKAAVRTAKQKTQQLREEKRLLEEQLRSQGALKSESQVSIESHSFARRLEDAKSENANLRQQLQEVAIRLSMEDEEQNQAADKIARLEKELMSLKLTNSQKEVSRKLEQQIQTSQAAAIKNRQQFEETKRELQRLLEQEQQSNTKQAAEIQRLEKQRQQLLARNHKLLDRIQQLTKPASKPNEEAPTTNCKQLEDQPGEAKSEPAQREGQAKHKVNDLQRPQESHRQASDDGETKRHLKGGKLETVKAEEREKKQ